MIYVVYCENQDSSSGYDFTGIFDTKEAADSFAKSEGSYYRVAETTFGPIKWSDIDPIEVDWNNL